MRIPATASAAPHLRPALLLAACLLSACKPSTDKKDTSGEAAKASSALMASTPGCPSLELERDVSVEGFLSDRYVWRDSACRPRSAIMVQNDRQDPAGKFGGYLRRYTYEVDGHTRVCDGGLENHPGWGYTVNHFDSAVTGNNIWSSSRDFRGTYRTVLAGRHHALHEYKWNIDFEGKTVRATVHWFFATGKDHPVWAVTFDSSLMPADTLKADTRAPYGDLLYDGNTRSEIMGVMWGDRYRFESTQQAPLSMSSGWDYRTPNLVPFVLSWTSSPDAEMGSVQTQTWEQHDAGGGWFYSDWGKSSAGPMPAEWNWPFQLNQYELQWDSRSHRLAWGSNYGAVGYRQYLAYGNDRNHSGYPYQSYSVFMVLGRHSTRTVLSQVEQVEAFQNVQLTASVGQVLTQGPAGVGRTDTVNYAPVGYNPLYATWEVQAASNQAQLSITTGTRPVDSPVFVLRGYTATVPPASVRLGGVELRPDLDYFASVDDAGDALWLTLARSVSGTVSLSIQ